jgi:hypothetical protein
MSDLKETPEETVVKPPYEVVNSFWGRCYHLRPNGAARTLCGITTYAFRSFFEWEAMPEHTKRCSKCLKIAALQMGA